MALTNVVTILDHMQIVLFILNISLTTALTAEEGPAEPIDGVLSELVFFDPHFRGAANLSWLTFYDKPTIAVITPSLWPFSRAHWLNRSSTPQSRWQSTSSRTLMVDHSRHPAISLSYLGRVLNVGQTRSLQRAWILFRSAILLSIWNTDARRIRGHLAQIPLTWNVVAGMICTTTWPTRPSTFYRDHLRP